MANTNQKLSPYAVASLVFGIIVWALNLVTLVGTGKWVNMWIFGLLAIVAGERFRQLNKTSVSVLRGKALALVGTILGIISVLIGFIELIIDKINAPL